MIHRNFYNNQRISRAALLAVLAHCLMTAPANAQSMQGSIVGTVTDASGAGVPNVKVTATNDRTSFSRTAQSNTSGFYELPNLDPSEYSIKAEAPGFKSFTNKKVPLANRESLRIDIRLDVGDVAQEVTVEGQVPVIRTEDAKCRVVPNSWNGDPALSMVSTFSYNESLYLIGGTVYLNRGLSSPSCSRPVSTSFVALKRWNSEDPDDACPDRSRSGFANTPSRGL